MGTNLVGRRCVGSDQSAAPPEASGGRRSGCFCQLVEGCCDAESGAGVNAKSVVAASEVLHEGVTSDDHTGRSVGLQAAHRSEPGLEPPVVVLDAIVGVLSGVMMRGRDQVADRPGQHSRLVGGHLNWLAVSRDRQAEELRGCYGGDPKHDDWRRRPALFGLFMAGSTFFVGFRLDGDIRAGLAAAVFGGLVGFFMWQPNGLAGVWRPNTESGLPRASRTSARSFWCEAWLSEPGPFSRYWYSLLWPPRFSSTAMRPHQFG